MLRELHEFLTKSRNISLFIMGQEFQPLALTKKQSKIISKHLSAPAVAGRSWQTPVPCSFGLAALHSLCSRRICLPRGAPWLASTLTRLALLWSFTWYNFSMRVQREC